MQNPLQVYADTEGDAGLVKMELVIPPLFQSIGILQLFKKVLRNSLVMFLQLI